MKKLLLSLFVLFFLKGNAQTIYPSSNINLISLINPNNGSSGIGTDGRRYSGCWGWHQNASNKEYAISGGSSGTYFIDVTNPATPSVSAYVPGKQGCTWREMKTYQNYCYVISDDASPNTFQIIDMSALPSTVNVVYSGTSYFERGHTIWIDNDKMYIGSVTYAGGSSFSSMNVYSLATPTAPVLLRSLEQDASFINHVHDMFARNDTVFASCGFQGLYIFRYNSTANIFEPLGSYTSYSSGSYNHSSFLTQDGKYLMFADEVPAAQPLRIIDVQNMANIQPVKDWLPHPGSTPHNPYLIGNQWAIVSCYQDGLIIYDISNPTIIHQAGYFDTYPQGGANTGNYNGNDYRGNWGAYPYLPSGIIIANDMQNGVFILNPQPAYNNPVTTINHSMRNLNVSFYPNPAMNYITVSAPENTTIRAEVYNMLGEKILMRELSGSHSEINVQSLSEGSYILCLNDGELSINKKLIIKR
jgi:choice-of-anchor B domain-containing protein